MRCRENSGVVPPVLPGGERLQACTSVQPEFCVGVIHGPVLLSIGFRFQTFKRRSFPTVVLIFDLDQYLDGLLDHYESVNRNANPKRSIFPILP
jgi:hypothetical protein